MHYEGKAFSVHAVKETITPIPDASVEIGQRQEMSKTDILISLCTHATTKDSSQIVSRCIMKLCDIVFIFEDAESDMCIGRIIRMIRLNNSF